MRIIHLVHWVQQGPVESCVTIELTVAFNTHRDIFNPAVSSHLRPDFEMLLVRLGRVQYIVIHTIKAEISCCSIRLLHIMCDT